METLGTVLVLEPDPEVQQKIRAALPYERVIFTSDKSNISNDPMINPAALIVDVDRSSISGLEFLRSLPFLQSVPLVVITAHPETRSARSGGHYLPEPLQLRLQDMGMLRKRLAKAIDDLTALKAFQHAFVEARVALRKGPTSDFTQGEQAVLKSVGFPFEAALSPEPIAQRAAYFERLRETSLTTEQGAQRLHVNPSRIRQRLTARPPQLYGMRQGSEWRLPAFQFAKDGLVPNIDAVIARLPPDIDPVAVDLWFRSPHVDLEHNGERLSPLDWLSQGFPPQPLAALAEDL